MESSNLELSSKITNSVYVYLESRGHVAGDYLEQAELPVQKALDSEMWIPLERVEYFLDLISKDIPDFSPKEVALNANEIRGWGLLDQVLRILQSPSEIYEDPQKFLSYFVRPDLGFQWVDRNDGASSFLLNISTEETPFVADYLTGALEAVSKYVSGENCHVRWTHQSVFIDWSKKQDSFFSNKKEPVNYKPEIYKEAVAIIEQQRNELLEYKSQKTSGALAPNESIELLEDLKVLNDYFLRSRQLVALLKAESGKKKWFKDALKRLNWDQLQDLHNDRLESIRAKLLKKPQSDENSKPEQIDFMF